MKVRGIDKPAVFKIVGLPGDRGRADETGVYVNNTPVSGFSPEFLTRFKREWTPVPNGHYVVMGEQRLNDDIAENMSLVPVARLEPIR